MPSAEQAHLNAVNGVSALRDLYEEAVRKARAVDTWKRHSEQLQKRIDQLEERLDAHRIPRIVMLETKVAELETTERRLREFMRLKDLAKIKVEKQRDTAQRERDALKTTVTLLRGQAQEAESLRQMNSTQASAYQSKEQENMALRKQYNDVKARLDNVMRFMREVAEGTDAWRANPYGHWEHHGR